MSMQNDFLGVEKELREITAGFASGHMNAFGSKATQDAFFRELKIIAEIEAHVFNKTCSILKQGNEDDHALLTGMFASAGPPSPHVVNSSTEGNGHHVPRSSTPTPQKTNGTMGAAAADTHCGDSLRGNSQGADETILSGRLTGFHNAVQFTQVCPNSRKSTHTHTPASPTGGDGANVGGGVAGGIPLIQNVDWNDNSGVSDKSFETVTERFNFLEKEFSTLGKRLQDILKHVTQLNAMSRQMNEGFTVGSDNDDAN